MKNGAFLPIFLVVTITPPVYAQNTGSTLVPIVAANGSGRIYGGGAGTYHQIEERVTDVAVSVLREARITQTEDINYVKAAVLEIHEAYKAYASLLISDKLLDLQASGIRGNSIDISDFLKVTAEIKAKKAAFDSLLVKNASINKSVLPSNYTAVLNADSAKQQQQVPTSGMINLSPVVSEYTKLIVTELNPQLSSFRNIKVNINGIRIGIEKYKDILNPDFSSVPPYSPEELGRMNADVDRLRDQARNVGEEQRRNFADSLRNEYNDFSRRHGSDYRYVARSGGKKSWLDRMTEVLTGTDESQAQTGKGDTVAIPGITVDTDIAARNASFKRLIDSFYLRSYARLSKGHQICALQPKMVPTTNFGALQAIEALKELRTETACTKVELENALQYSRLILKYSGAQSDRVFGDGKFMDAGLLNKLGSAVTFALGKRPSAEALHMLIQLVYADIQEELLMATPGEGLQALRAMYVARYQSTPDQKDYYSRIRCSVDFDADSCKDVPRDSFSETASVGTKGDILENFISLKQKISFSKDLLDQANLINEELVLMRAGRESSKNESSRKGKL